MVLGELELAWRLIPNEFVGVTGTNGKTTTTEWIGHVHREAGLPVAVAGNVGTAASSLIDRLAGDVTVVCEASSFQLEDTVAFSPEAAVLLNLSPDHLDRHGTYEDYVAAKLKIFANQGNYDLAVAPADLGIEDLGGALGKSRSVQTPGRTCPSAPAISGGRTSRSCPSTSSRCPARTTSGTRWRPPRFVSRAGSTPKPSRTACARSPGSATGSSGSRSRTASPGSTTPRRRMSRARSSHSRRSSSPIHLIAGGRGKQQDFSPLAPLVAERCRAVYLIGEAAGDLADALANTGVPLHQAGDLERAVALARGAAVPGEVVLLSPACASYDQYPDFEARGDHFRALVEAL